MRHIYPSLRLFFSSSSEVPPYGGVLSIIATAFFLVVFIPLPVLLASIGAIIWAGFLCFRAMPLSATLMVAALGSGVALIGYQPNLVAELSPKMAVIFIMASIFPVLIVPASRHERTTLFLLHIIGIAMAILAAAILIELGGTLVHSAIDALLILSVIAAALYYHHTRKAGSFGLAALLPLSYLVGFALVSAAMKHAPEPALGAGVILMIAAIYSALSKG